MKISRSMRLGEEIDSAIVRECAATGKGYSEIIEDSLTVFFQIRTGPRKPYQQWVAQMQEAAAALREMGFTVDIDLKIKEDLGQMKMPAFPEEGEKGEKAEVKP